MLSTCLNGLVYKKLSLKEESDCKAHVVELVAENIQTNVEKPEQDTEDSMTTFGLELPSMDDTKQQIQAVKEEHTKIEE